MPHLPRKPKKPRPKRKPTGKQKELYQNSRWHRFSAAYRRDNPLCEACKAQGITTDVTPGGYKGVTDHIIRATVGGSWYDTRNLMALCTKHHNLKTSMEGRGAFDWLEGVQNEYGYKIPTDAERAKVVELLTE